MKDQARVRFRATVHYDGSGFHGWQVQPRQRTVQGELTSALARLLPEAPPLLAAGRTDRGVHAAGQEVSFPAPGSWSAGEMRRALNAVLPEDVWIERLRATSGDFHPRFDATARRYEYLVGTRPEAASPLLRRRLWALCEEPDGRLLRSATRLVPGERSYGALAKSGQPERGTRCRIRTAAWSRTAAGDLKLAIVADRFLHHMVRYLASTLVEIGTGARGPEEMALLLSGDDEAPPPRPAPAAGLYLTGVEYADGWNRPAGIPGVADGADLRGPGSPRSSPEGSSLDPDRPSLSSR